MRILIVEDSEILRAGLERLLDDAGHEVVASIPSVEGLSEIVEAHSPALALMDVRMPPTFTDEGIRAAAMLRSRYPELKVLIFSQYVEERYASEFIRDGGGGFGYLLKDRVAHVAQFLDSIARIAQGETVLDPEVVAQILVRSRRAEQLASLSPREREVLGLMAEGLANSAIAERLYITASVVEKHVNSVFTKLGLVPVAGENRRVLAVLRYLEGSSQHSQGES
ncbi:response regulator [Haematomicrobium sanguinis]|uniref:response regulator n=1 Tax=Haematomicrobium sanguinis TaxID=479106 RepID=UPI00047BA3A1|nr:response regulator transcription factor [Haematomicrobium sanguinis]